VTVATATCKQAVAAVASCGFALTHVSSAHGIRYRFYTACSKCQSAALHAKYRVDVWTFVLSLLLFNLRQYRHPCQHVKIFQMSPIPLSQTVSIHHCSICYTLPIADDGGTGPLQNQQRGLNREAFDEKVCKATLESHARNGMQTL